jgi:hypothetical protein
VFSMSSFTALTRSASCSRRCRARLVSNRS